MGARLGRGAIPGYLAAGVVDAGRLEALARRYGRLIERRWDSIGIDFHRPARYSEGKEVRAMPDTSVDRAVPGPQAALLRQPQDLPHGLIAPPPEVRELIEKERAKHPPEAFARAEEGLLNLWTVAHVFDGLCYEILYRPTPRGPEVLAVGFDEVFARTNGMDPARMEGLKSYLPYE
jgi:hypothetical protein